MGRRVAIAIAALAALATTPARADLIVNLAPQDASMNPIEGDVPVNGQVFVDILLSVDGDDNPLADLRGLIFDFAATDSAIVLGAFTWDVDPIAYSFRTDAMPAPSATSLLFSSGPGLISLDEVPQSVATIAITVNADGTLDAIGSTGLAQTSQATFSARFDFPVAFSLAAGSLRAGTLDLTVAGPTALDRDGDGVPNTDDAFPDDPTESVDTDGDGIGNNADAYDDADGTEDSADDFPLDPTEVTDTDGDGVGDNADPDDDGDNVIDGNDVFPLDPTEWADSDGDGIGDNAEMDTEPQPTPRMCGTAMLGTSLFILCGLGGLRAQRRIYRQRGAT